MISKAKESYEYLATFRRKRNRCRDYTYGRQWNDLIEVNGKSISEYEYIISEGNVPLKNNLIRRIVRNVLGVFRERLPDIMKEEYGTDSGLSADMVATMERIAAENSLSELYCRTLEEFLISGMAVHRKRLCRIDGSPHVVTEMVSPGSFFFNSDSRDIRGRDITLIGQIHEVGYSEWCASFVKTKSDFKEVKSLFGSNTGRKLKVVELWQKEMVPRYLVHDRKAGYVRKVSEEDIRAYRKSEYPQKWIMDEVWRYYFLTEEGRILKSGDSPYIHRSHPYILKCYPFLDGEIQSFVGDMIDQQRYTNRLITLYDWVIRSSAKGVLLVPESAVDPADYQSMADQWSRFNGVIVYKPKAGVPEPRQVSGNLNNLGISDLLEIQLKMLEDVSGVNGILQGNTSGGNVSGTLYASQTANALYSLSDILETFRGFIRDCARMDRGVALGVTAS